MLQEQIAQVRRFHRVVTQRAGALEDRFLGRDRPLGESRVLYEIGPAGADLRDVRARLGLDSGYLSRIVQSLGAQGLVEVSAAEADERVRRARLTAAGLREYEEMEGRADDVAAGILAPLTVSQRERLVSAMDEVQRLLMAAGTRIQRADPSSRDARWCVQQYFAELTERFPLGFDATRSLPAEDADLRPPRGVFLIARVDGETVASGALKGGGPGIGSIKRMWVSPTVRGLGIGRRMLDALESEARAMGMHTVRLETNGTLAEAISLYRSAGYAEVDAFNDDPYAQHWFEKRLPALSSVDPTGNG